MKAELGGHASDLLPKLGVLEATIQSLKKKYRGKGGLNPHRVKELQEENRLLRGLVADLSLDKQILHDMLSKHSEA